MAAKNIMGENELKQFRAKIILKHTQVIKKFVDTNDSKFGQSVLNNGFEAIDKNGDGVLDMYELDDALKSLGFSWLEKKQMEGILKKADKNKDGTIDIEEFKKAAPATLATNLVKLAKKNGDELGFLS
eukprot:CAMPEP_0171295854 /NCGR_PEP_ID=MMETSP0816-20121228/4496_1 /TAXON_ID=420281 /ORGANISM="Proboscia inermis, Strain CCAP1064/1" /LENGTH=127 /DNA_ID=CAMNT_0011768845 /DNA_START=319 /DNA_END=702 /DNA_ORIENTATION=-